MFLALGATTVQAKEKATIKIVMLQETSINGTLHSFDAKTGCKFVLEDGTEMVFQKVAPEVLKSVDLKLESSKGKVYEVKYTSKKVGEVIVNTIVSLKEVVKK